MAIDSAYASAATYRALLSKSDTGDDGEILDDLTAISRYLDRRLGRFFTVDAAVTTRVYPASGRATLNVEDISSTTGLLVAIDDNEDGTAEKSLTITTDFELRPLNAAKGPEPQPFTQLYLPARVTRSSWDHLVQVTAKHGWPSVPKAIERATVHLAGIVRLESPRATSRVPEGVDAAIETSAEGQRIVDRLSAVYAKPAWIYS